jgi:4-hydroxy-tetrahydrodipicolinate synthase
MIRQCLNGEYAAANKTHGKLIDFTRLMFVDGSPAGVKAALKNLGVCGDTLRLPLVQVSDAIGVKIIAEIQKILQ